MARIIVQFMNEDDDVLSAVVCELEDEKLPPVVTPGITLHFTSDDPHIDDPWNLDLEECVWDIDELSWRFISKVNIGEMSVKEAVKEAVHYGFQEFWSPSDTCDCADCEAVKDPDTTSITYRR